MDLSRNRAALVTAALIVVLFLVPWTRDVLVFQTKLGITPSSSFQSLIPDESRLPSPLDAGDALVIGHRESSRAKSIAPYEELIARYPGEPALYASLLRYAGLYGPLTHINRPDLDPPPEGVNPTEWKPLADTRSLRLVETAIARGRKLDPDNAVFDFYEAELRFAQRRDVEALAAIHRAAGKQEFNDYSRAEMEARLRDLRRSMGPALYWISPLQRVTVSAAMLFPHFSGFRQVARMASGHVRQDIEDGNTREAMSIVSDTVKMGGTIQDGTEWAIGALVGMAMERIPVRHAYESLVEPIPGPTHPKDADIQHSELLSAVQVKAPDALSPAEWQLLANRINAADALQHKIKVFFNDGYFDSHLRLMTANVGLLSLGGTFLLMSAAFGVLWLVTHLWLAHSGRTGLQAGPGRLSIWLLALLPVTVVLGVVVAMGQTPVHYLFTGPSDIGYHALDVLAMGLKILMVALVVVIALAGITRMQRGARLDGFLARLRNGSLYAIQGLLALYLISTLLNIPLTAHLNRDIDRCFMNEMQMVRDFQPPVGK